MGLSGADAAGTGGTDADAAAAVVADAGVAGPAASGGRALGMGLMIAAQGLV
jgi:hypothetical protein